MTDAPQVNEVDAIRQVIAAGGVLDFADVVNKVLNRFGIEVDAGRVEQVYQELATSTPPAPPRVRTSVAMTAVVPDADDVLPQSTEVDANTRADTSASAPVQQKSIPVEPEMDDVAHALRYVKSVGGMANARRILDELQRLLLDQK